MPDSPPDSLYSDASFYEMLFRERVHDLPFYRALAEEHEGPILELGAGTGRVSVMLAKEGREVVAVDAAPKMLEALEARRDREGQQERVTAHLSEVGELDLGRRFELVIAPFNALAHSHSWEQLSAFFEGARRHLAPGGTFAFDVLSPDATILDESNSIVPSFEHPGDGKIYRFEERMHYAPLAQILSIDSELRPLKEEGEAQILSLRLRVFFPKETELMLERFGWQLEERRVLADVLAYRCRDRAI